MEPTLPLVHRYFGITCDYTKKTSSYFPFPAPPEGPQEFFNKTFSFQCSKFFKAFRYPLVIRALNLIAAEYRSWNETSPTKLTQLHKNLQCLIDCLLEMKEYDVALRELSPMQSKWSQPPPDEIGTMVRLSERELKESEYWEAILITPYFGEKISEIKPDSYKKILAHNLRKIVVEETLRLSGPLDEALQHAKLNAFGVTKISEGTKAMIEMSLDNPLLESEMHELNALRYLVRHNQETFTYLNPELKKITETLRENRKKSPISTNSIVGLSDLYRKAVDAQVISTWELVETRLDPNERNLVYTDKQTFFKEATKGPTDHLEILAFQTACIFGVDSSFATTASWQVTKDSQTLKGSIQPKIEGRKLSQRFQQSLLGDPVITQTELIKASLVTFLFGMFDLNESNIFITHEGRFMFFDNSRSLPHGDIIISNEDILPAYRSCLLALPGSFEPLTLQERGKIVAILNSWKGRLKAFKAFIEREVFLQNSFKPPYIEFKNSLERYKYAKNKKMKAWGPLSSTLPPFWFNEELVLKEMKGRLERVEKAINEETVTLQDLAFACCPSFKLLLVLHIASFIVPSPAEPSADTLAQIQMNHLRSVGSIDFRALIRKCDLKKIDVDKIYSAINEPIKVLLTKLLREEFKKTGEQKPALLKTLVKQAEVELKDTTLKKGLETSKQREIMVQFVEYLLIKHEFNLFEYDFDYKGTFLGMKKEKEEEETKKETIKRDNAAKKHLSQQRYLILSPVNPQLDHFFTLMYQDKGKIKEVMLDFTIKTSEVSIDQHALTSLPLVEFKEFCEALPVSLRYLEKDTVTGVVEICSIVINGERFNAILSKMFNL